MTRKVYIVGGRRSPIGKFLGSLSTVLPGDLGSQVVRQVLEDTKVDPAAIDEVIFANQHSAGQGPSLARRVQREAGIPDDSRHHGQYAVRLRHEGHHLRLQRHPGRRRHHPGRRRGVHERGALHPDQHGPQGHQDGPELGQGGGLALLRRPHRPVLRLFDGRDRRARGGPGACDAGGAGRLRPSLPDPGRTGH